MGTEDQHHPESPNSEELVGSTEAEVDAAPVSEPLVPENEDPVTDQAPDEETDASANDTQSALDAIESVEQNAQSLIESAIDGLLDDDTSIEDVEVSENSDEAEEEISLEAIEAMLAKNNDEQATAPEDSEPEPEDAIAKDAASEDEPEESQLTDEAIDAELDALEQIQEPAQELKPEHESANAIEELISDTSLAEVDEIEETESEASFEAEESAEIEPALPDEVADEAEHSATEADTSEIDALQDPAEVSSELLDEIADGILETPEEPAVTEAEDTSALSDNDLLDEIANDLMNDQESQTISPIDDEGPSQEEREATVPDSELDAIDEALSAIGDTDISQEIPSKIEEAAVVEDDTEADQDSSEELDSNAIDAASTLEDLDATLAGIGDDLLAGDFETPDGELVDSSSLEEHDASALMSQLNIDDLGLGHDEAPETETEQAIEESESPKVEAPAPAPKPAPKQAPVAKATTPAPFIEEEPELAEAESIWQTGRRLSVTYAMLAWDGLKTHGAPLGAKVVLLVNTPVKDRPAQLRDSIGYLALWTLLLSTILWVYLVFVRVTPTPTPTQAPTRVLQPGEVVDPLRSADSTP